jgi:hypothetical protein
MILTKEVDLLITNTVITYYRNKGYDISTNKVIKVKVDDLPDGSHILITSNCDICDIDNETKYCDYIKNIKNGGFYSCKKCSHLKRKDTMLKKYNTGYIKNEDYFLSIKDKYDKITKKIEDNGYIICNKCNISNDLIEYRISKNGRYGKICRICRNKDFLNYNNNLDSKIKQERDKKYYRDYIHVNMWRSILKSTLNRLGHTKNSKSNELIGYNSLSLKIHLESLFNDNMSWKNYGRYWEVDHIIPVSLFKEDTDVGIVNSLDNLRPLCKIYNNSRGNKLDEKGYEILDKYKTYIKDEYIKIN